MAVLLRLIKDKWYPPTVPSTASFSGQTVLITGATTGLGLESAIKYVELGAATVIITARSSSRGAAAKALIEKRTGRLNVVQVRELDMDTFAAVKAFVEGLEKDVRAIDVVMLNAGLMELQHRLSPDGWEETLQVNTLSTLLLAVLMIPWMKKAKPPGGGPQHMAIVSSGRFVANDIQAESFPKKGVLEFWNQKENFNGGQQYSLSKLLLMYAAEEITKMGLGEDGSPSVIVNTTCPGLCKSDLARGYTNKGFLFKILVGFFLALLAKTTETGARSLVMATMTTPEENGKCIRHYSTPEQLAESSHKVLKTAEGKALQAEVWREIVETLQAKVPDVSKLVAGT